MEAQQIADELHERKNNDAEDPFLSSTRTKWRGVFQIDGSLFCFFLTMLRTGGADNADMQCRFEDSKWTSAHEELKRRLTDPSQKYSTIFDFVMRFVNSVEQPFMHGKLDEHTPLTEQNRF